MAKRMANFYWSRFRYKFLVQQSELRCFYCSRPNLLIKSDEISNVAQIDHVVPICKGGSETDYDNLVVCCASCNLKKGTKTLSEWMERE